MLDSSNLAIHWTIRTWELWWSIYSTRMKKHQENSRTFLIDLKVHFVVKKQEIKVLVLRSKYAWVIGYRNADGRRPALPNGKYFTSKKKLIILLNPFSENLIRKDQTNVWLFGIDQVFRAILEK